jgi:predicted AlkP superfamily pyrophosphatase or phosphodiesterase
MLALAVAVALASPAWAQQRAPAPTPAPAPASPASSVTVPRAERVVIISIDGLRADLLIQANVPNIRALLREGSYTFFARTVAEGYTLPAHASMLTGVSPQKHGITWNEHIEESYPESPTVFEVAKQAGLTTALASGKTKFIVFDKPGTLDWKYLPRDEPVLDTFVAQQAVQIVRDHKPQLLFVHLPGVDVVGHAIGWGSPEQVAWLGEADKAVGTVLAAVNAAGLRPTTTVILTADHGGAGVEHGPNDERSRYIPWVVVGPGVRKGMDLTRYPDLTVNITDTFATACAVLGAKPKSAVEGKPVNQISAEFPDPPREPKVTQEAGQPQRQPR